jgi:NAD(P)-dependent dehydrogenase (short-subunit alcohol dehydrogenase family)
MNQVAIITGANRGIGLEVVKQLAQKGFTVVAGSRDLARGQAALQGVANVEVRALDISSADSANAFGQWFLEKFDRLDALVNNAAINYDDWHNVKNANLEEVQETLNTNLLGAWRVTQALLPALEGTQDSRVVNVSSGSGQWSSMTGGTPGYSLSKLALNGLTRMFAAQLKGVKVNAVCPGWVATDMGGGGRPIPEGAAGVVWAATEVNTTGGFFRDGKPLEW